MARFLLPVLFLLIMTTTAIAQCYNLVWADEFNNSSIDTDKWSYQTGAGGWGNNELQNYTDRVENTTVTGGTLQIIAKSEAYNGANYTSARIRSIRKGDWTYGRMEANIKLPVGQGIWPAFWMMPTESVYGGWPKSGEIDIMEYLGHQPSINYGTCHFGNASNDKSSSGNSQNISPSSYADGAFHTFSIEWEPTQIRWYVDGLNYHIFNASEVGAYTFPFDEDFHFIFNVAVGGNWPGSPDGTTVFPQTMEVDYVRVYQELEDIDILGEIVQTPTATGTIYSVPALSGASYSWEVPIGASITNGTGTHEINVDWGTTAGAISVLITNACGAVMVVKNVTLSPNQSPNPGFEEDFSNWDPDTFNGAAANWTISTSDVHSGGKSMCAEVTNLSPNAWDVQISPLTVDLVVGEEYTISFWSKADANNRTASLAVINSTTYSYYTGKTFTFTEEWTEYSHTFTAIATAIGSINIQFGHELGTYCLDDFLFAKTSDLPITLSGISLKVMLEGPYENISGLMRDDLRSYGMIPHAQPHTELGFVAANSTENEMIQDPSTIFAVTGDNAIVDWIFVELRNSNDPSLLVATRSALLQADGDIVEVDGVSALSFPSMYAGDYFVAIRHRNHLKIRSLSTVSLTATSALSLDFSSTLTPVVGTNSRKDIGGVLLLWAGDANSGNSIDATDRSETWNNRNQSGYFSVDVNLDGICDASDRAITWNNRNKVGQE